jgi:hypothetical protein
MLVLYILQSNKPYARTKENLKKKTALYILSYAAMESRQNNNKYVLNYSRIPLVPHLTN